MRTALPIFVLAAAAWAAPLRTVETRLATLRLNPDTGDLVGLTWRSPRVEILEEPRLGENFRILIPRDGQESNYFLSGEQSGVAIDAGAEGVTVAYPKLRNAREQVPVSVRYRIRAVEKRLEFSIEVDNPTDAPVAEVYFGVLGGHRGVGSRPDTESFAPGWQANAMPRIFRDFRGGGYGGGNLGIRASVAGFTYPGSLTMPWLEFSNPKTGTGLYYADHDPEPRMAALYMELHPFHNSAVVGETWPSPADVADGAPIGLKLGWVKFPYTRKGTFRSAPVVLQLHAGDWHAASRLYRAWYDSHFDVKRPPTWLRQEMAWQSVIISDPEDVVHFRFRDLPRLAADAKKYGVTTFEILGWDIGGIDRGYPQYTPDPRLGTREEFRAALKEIRAMGVHPLIFANVQFADTSTGLYRERLHRYAVKGRWADDLPVMGWGYGTIGSRFGFRRRNMTNISPAHPEVRDLLLGMYEDLVRDGAEGFQLDKTVVTSMLDFNPALETTPDRSIPESLLAMLRETLWRGRAIDPRFTLASETMWDRTFPYVDVSYLRMNEIDMNSPVSRYTFPEWTSTIFAESPGDINIMNNGMRYGLVWAVAPLHYNDSMDTPQMRPLSRYVQELIRIRARFKDPLFLGRFRDTEGAKVQGGPQVRYSVFESMTGRGKAVVAVNYGNTPATATVDWAGADRGVRVAVPFQAERDATLPARVELPPRTCAVIAGSGK
jgi:hypothetical protein